MGLIKIKTAKNDKKFNIYTDLALEACELIGDGVSVLDGIATKVETNENEDITVTIVDITNKNGAKQMGKPIGSYITIESPYMKDNDTYCHEEISEMLANKLSSLKKLDANSSILVVGLGNWNVTPDALGPKVISKLLVTRHIHGSLPKEIDESVRPVSAVSPGVMGITGIETLEIVKGIVDRIKPDLVIAIDALAARKTSRINKTIQISNTGISPGAGLGNNRKMISKDVLGVDVIAIGVPTVVDAATLVNDTLDKMIKEMKSAMPNAVPFYEMLETMENEDKHQLIYEVLNPYEENMFVTPKEVDAVIERLSTIIANAINIALHPGINKEDMNRYLG